MRKNVASQKIGCQMVSASDGSAFTGAVTVSVTGDAGTQATGSVGSGACTHEGNGYHTYAPAQAETNYDLVAFTFTGTGAIPSTVQVYTLPTTGILAPATADRTLVVDAAGLADANMVKVGPSGSGTAQTAKDIGGAVPAAAAGASGGLLISGSNSGTTTLGALTVTGATTCTGNVSMAAGLNITQSSANTSALVVTGNGTGHGAIFTSGSGATGNAITLLSASTNGHGLKSTGTGTGDGMELTAGASGADLDADIAGVLTTVTTATNVTTVNGLAAGVITAASIAADAITDAKVAADVTIASVTGAVGSVTGAVGSVTGNVGGNVTGSVGSVATGGIAAASFAAGAIDAAAVADGAIDRATFAADTGLQTTRSNTAQAGGATSITLDASASATTDYYINQLVYLTGGTGAGQSRFCTAYNGTTKVATVNSAWATNPDNTTTFALIPFDAIPGATAPTAAAVADAVWDEARSGHVAAGSFGEYVLADAIAISGDATAANNAESFFDGTGYAGTNNVIPTVTTLTNLPAITANWLTAAGTAADFGTEVGAAVLSALGTGSWATSLAPASTALSTVQWTNTLATNLGTTNSTVATNLDATITSRMATYTQPTGFLAATFPTTVASTTNITAGTITTVTNLTNAPTAGDLTSTMKASVNTEVLDVLNVDTFAEPTGAPAATATLAEKIGRGYQALRNKITVTSSAKTFYSDAGASLWSKALSDDGTTYTEAEGA